MNRLIALGITIGVLAGLFTWVSGSISSIGGLAAPLVVWVGFAAWACYYAAGGGKAGLGRVLLSNGSGLLWGWLILSAATLVNGSSAAVLGLFVALGAFGMCVQAFWGPLSFIPGAFVGAAAFFGNDTLFLPTPISLVAGALLAYLSELAADVLLSGSSRRSEPSAS